MKTYQNPKMTVLFVNSEMRTDVLSVSNPNVVAVPEIQWLDFIG